MSGWEQGFGCWEFSDLAWVTRKWRCGRACRGAARAASVARCRSRCVRCTCGRAACAVRRRPAWRWGRRARVAHKYLPLDVEELTHSFQLSHSHTALPLLAKDGKAKDIKNGHILRNCAVVYSAIRTSESFLQSHTSAVGRSASGLGDCVKRTTTPHTQSHTSPALSRLLAQSLVRV